MAGAVQGTNQVTFNLSNTLLVRYVLLRLTQRHRQLSSAPIRIGRKIEINLKGVGNNTNPGTSCASEILG